MVDTKILSSLLGYKGSTTVTTPNFEVEVNGGEKIVGGGSQYSPGGITGQGTLSVSVAKAIEELNNGSAIAYYNGNRSVAERVFTDDAGNVTYAREFACYTTTGTVCAGRIENGVINQIQVGYGKRFGTVVMEALFPVLVDTDSEFDNNLDNIFFKLLNEDDFKVILASLSDNVYYRLKDGKFKLNAKEKGGSWNVSLIQQGSIEAGLYSITSEETKIIGSLNDSYLAQFANGAKPITKKTTSAKQLAGMYANENDELSDSEKALVPNVPKYIVVPEYVPTVCEIISKTRSTNRPVQNVLFTGPAGTGKSLNSVLIASAFNKPRVIMVGSSSMEIIDLTGTYVPRTSKGIETGIDALPSIEDIDFDLEGSYKRLTGEAKMPKGVTFEEVINILFEKQQAIINNFGGSDGGSDFIYIQSPLVQAVKYGWVVECQEFNMILNSGVLTGLNSILEGGQIQLPTGEVVHRHPESIIVFTMNTNYEGCRPLNQSVLDRFPIKVEVPLPDDKEIIKRVKKVCDCKDTAFVTNQLECYKAIVEYLSGQGYNGVLGMRSLYDWTLTAITLGDMLQAAEFTILESAMPSLLEDAERAELKDFIRNNILAPNVMNVNVA